MWPQAASVLRTSRLFHEVIVSPNRREVRYVYNFAPVNTGDIKTEFARYLLVLCRNYPDGLRSDHIALTVSMLSAAQLLNGSTIKQWIESDFGNNLENLSRLAAALKPVDVENIASELDILDAPADRCVNSLEWRRLATGVWGSERVEALMLKKRQELTLVTSNRREIDRLRFATQAAWTGASAPDVSGLELLRLKFQADSRGLRGARQLASVCLNCGTQAQRQSNQRWACPVCKADWYSNHCWNCKTATFVDSRDAETPPCRICNWCKCARCGACKKPNCGLGAEVDQGAYGFDDIPF